ncbi:hypothetical protein [Streptomyces lutosisoli]|uniref:Uncharacterized protein n=1 Tax=Streptomyces lutosisoli TaxID=2665721 RepID=A0ABW2VS07_9ACTN
MSEPKSDLLSRLWDEFRIMPFPRGFYRREPDGECMVSMDTSLAGCVSVALEGSLDDGRREVLRTRIAILGKILPSIGDDEYGTKYFTLLYEMAVLAAELDHARGE